MSATDVRRRPQADLRAAKSFGGDMPSVSHRHSDPNHRRPAANAGEHLFAAKWAQFEKVATEIVEDFDHARYSRASRIYSGWAERYAELNDPEQARECHGISLALDNRAQLIRMYPGEFTDTMAILADIFEEKRGA